MQTFDQISGTGAGTSDQIHRARTASEIVTAFARFQEALTFYRTVPLLPYDEAAVTHFARLRQVLHHRPGTQDLRIAAIVLSRNAALVTRNQRDFADITGLQLEDWSASTS